MTSLLHGLGPLTVLPLAYIKLKILKSNIKRRPEWTKVSNQKSEHSQCKPELAIWTIVFIMDMKNFTPNSDNLQGTWTCQHFRAWEKASSPYRLFHTEHFFSHMRKHPLVRKSWKRYFGSFWSLAEYRVGLYQDIRAYKPCKMQHLDIMKCIYS